MSRLDTWQFVDNLPKAAKEIPGYPGYYIAPTGEIYSTFRFKGIRRLSDNKLQRGYKSITLYRNKTKKMWAIHKLVMLAFALPKPFEKAVARHKDGDKFNNHIDNLEWGTYKDNHNDAKKHGTWTHGTKQGQAKLTDEIVKEIRFLYKPGSCSFGKLAKRYNVSPCTIKEAYYGITWRHVA